MKIRHLHIENFRGIKKLDWNINTSFVCLIGAGDSCKTTILNAIEYTLSPRYSVNFEDADFYDIKPENPIVIEVTLVLDNDASSESTSLFLADKFGRYLRGINDDGPTNEPEENGDKALVVRLSVDSSLDGKWEIVSGTGEAERFSSSDRIKAGCSRLEHNSDNCFAWGRNSHLARLTDDNSSNMNALVAEITRAIHSLQIDEKTEKCKEVATNIKGKADKIGVNIADLTPKIDIQKQSISSGSVSLHADNVPVRNLGMGSKRLLSTAMQMIVYEGKNIALIDELESGLEPHRIRGLISHLRQSGQQTFATTHSPVVLRELQVNKGELYVCRPDETGHVTIHSLKEVPKIQPSIRKNAEAFLGRKIVVCEGRTEIGLLRALDLIKYEAGQSPVWSASTVYFDAGGAGELKSVSQRLHECGYSVAVLCDNDNPSSFSDTNKTELEELGIKVFWWNAENSTEGQLFNDFPWQNLPSLIDAIVSANEGKPSKESIEARIVKHFNESADEELTGSISDWTESDKLRKAIAEVAAGKDGEDKKSFFKQIHLAEETFKHAIPLLPKTSTFHQTIENLWGWIGE
jgi:hypothetical protein